MDTDRAARLKQARLRAGHKTASVAALAHGWNRNTYASNENGNARFSFAKAKVYGAAFGVRPEWLYDGAGPMLPMRRPATRMQGWTAPTGAILVPVIGRVGSLSAGRVTMVHPEERLLLAPIPPGGTEKSVILLVDGPGLGDAAEFGALIYFEDRRSPPVAELIDHTVIAETTTGEILVGRLTASADLVGFAIEPLRGRRVPLGKLAWATPIVAIVPPYQASLILQASAKAPEASATPGSSL